MAAVFTEVTRNRFSPDGAMVALYFKGVCVCVCVCVCSDSSENLEP